MKTLPKFFCAFLVLGGLSSKAQSIVVDRFFDFGDVELNLKSFVDFKIKNSGNAPLIVSSASLTGSSEISCTCGVLSVPPGGEGSVRIAFTPTALAQFSANLIITSNDPASPTTIPFYGNGIPFSTLNTIILIDRSASMAGNAYRYQAAPGTGTGSTLIKTKIDAAMLVAKDYFNTVKSWSGVKLGIIEFNRNTIDAITYGPVPGTFPANPTPTDGSDFRRAFQRAWSLFPTPPPTPPAEKVIFLLISDGIEQRGTGLLDAIANNRDDRTHPPNHSDVKIYCIGVGQDSDVEKLKAISVASGVHDGYGYYYVDSDVKQLSGNTNDFFYRIWAHAKGYSTVDENGR